MKRIGFLIMVVVLVHNLILAQEEESTQYLETTRQTAATPTPTTYTACDQNWSRSLTFDLETISSDSYLDLAIGFSNLNSVGGVDYVGFQDYNNGSGGFPDQNGNFFSDNTTCNDNNRINNFLFGKMRTSVSRNDLVVLRNGGIYIYLNTGNGMSTSANQTITGDAATKGSLGSVQ